MSWNENGKNCQWTGKIQWCPTAFPSDYSRTISSLLIFLHNGTPQSQNWSQMPYKVHWTTQHTKKVNIYLSGNTQDTVTSIHSLSGEIWI